MIDYIKCFCKVILWGAGHLGTVLGRELLNRGVNIVEYWDLRASQKQECNGVHVTVPFNGNNWEGHDTLIIFCVTSGLIQKDSLDILEKKGCKYIEGFEVYQEICCPVSLDNLELLQCCNRIECNVDTCSKLNKMLFENYFSREKVFIETVYLFVTQKCSLKCKYCIAYMNSYSIDQKIHYSIERIESDIECLTEAASFIKRVVIYGGEPFLHPNINRIVKKLASKNNVGIIDIVSNGIFSFEEKEIEGFDSIKNLRVEISNYDEAIPEELIDIRDKNIDQMKKMGLHPFLHGKTPEWIKPRTFYHKNLSVEEMCTLKMNCDYFVSSHDNEIMQSMVVANGFAYPCRMACSVRTLGVADYEEDRIQLAGMSASELAIRISELYRKDFFSTCGHCEMKQGEITPIAGEQGFDERYSV